MIYPDQEQQLQHDSIFQASTAFLVYPSKWNKNIKYIDLINNNASKVHIHQNNKDLQGNGRAQEWREPYEFL